MAEPWCLTTCSFIYEFIYLYVYLYMVIFLAHSVGVHTRFRGGVWSDGEERSVRRRESSLFRLYVLRCIATKIIIIIIIRTVLFKYWLRSMCTSESTVSTTAHRSVSIREFNIMYVLHNHFVNVSKNSFSTKGASAIARGTHNGQMFSQLIRPRQSPQQHRHMMAYNVETHRLMWNFLHSWFWSFVISDADQED